MTLRGTILGILGLFVITTSSMYVALRMGALPWPTVFVTVLAMTVLGKAKNSTLQEINVTHTLMSSGAMVAGGLAFTIPGLWIMNPDATISVWTVLVLTLTGAVLGTLFSAIYRPVLLGNERFVFPIGNAAFETLKTGIHNGKQSVKLFGAMLVSIIFTALRDSFGVIPALVSAGGFSMWLSPMAFAIGSMIGRLSAYLWLGGAVIGLFIPSTVIKQSLGIGIMLGTGAAVLVKAVIGFVRDARKAQKKSTGSIRVLPVVLVCVAASLVLTVGTELTLMQSLLTVIGAAVVTLLSGMMTGQSGINPMEVFGILVMLAIAVFSHLGVNSMFIIAGVTAVSCGLCGDVMNDLKSGKLLGTDPKQQLISEGIGGVIGAALSVVALFAMKRVFGTFGSEVLPAPQAVAVATMAGGFGDILWIAVGFVIGFVLFVVNVPAATLGLGIYLANYISFAVGIGAVISNLIKRFTKVTDNDLNLVSSGFLGGEGITGVIIAIIAMLS